MALATAGCDVGEASYQPIDAPPVHLIEARATTGLDQNYQPVRTPLDPSGATEVLSTASFVLKFDRFLLPGSVSGAVGPGSLCVSGDLATEVRTFADCVNPIALAPTYNPVQREVIFRQVEGMSGLFPGTRYALTVLGPVDEAAPAGIRAFDGAPLDANVRIEFTVAATNPPQAMPERQPSGDFYCQRDLECIGRTADCQDNPDTPANDPADPECHACVKGAASLLYSCVQCHSDGNAAAGLNLSVAKLETSELMPGKAILKYTKPDPLYQTAIGHAAHQTQMGERAHVGEETPQRFGRAMPLIDPGNPGNSYLLYKMIVGQSALDPSLPAEQAEKLREETERLRAAFVMGMPMPPPQSDPWFWFHPQMANDPNVTVYVDGMDILSAWILDGAEPRDCSVPPPP
ncbi:hypothetical protein WME75_14910 [Sorangium sp. So ce1014]|uniref:hypothetical protein n=1 Tax=Sorangium sp. So ce1014 TaxID=3133326 RepID=UPI003F60D174